MEHYFNTDIAKDYGIEEAIVLHHLFFWVNKNAANGVNYIDGSFWTYNSVSGFAKLFGYMNEKKIKRVLSSLVEKGLIKKGNHNQNKMVHTNWYAFTEKGLEYLASHQYNLSQTIGTKCTNRKDQNGSIDKPEKGQSNKDSKQEDINKDINIIPTDVGLSSTDDATKVDYDKLIKCFNDEIDRNRAVIPKIVSISGKRRISVNARVKEHGKFALSAVIRKATISPFLNGRNNRAFVASFDWLIKPNNFIKVLEGNYDDNVNNIANGTSRNNIEKEQRVAEVAAIMDRLMAADDAERAQ